MKIKVNVAHPAASILKLSYREFEIFCAIACGESPQLTAEKYHLSPKTISTYRQRIMDKLELESNAEIAVLAYKYGVTSYENESANPDQIQLPLEGV